MSALCRSKRPLLRLLVLVVSTALTAILYAFGFAWLFGWGWGWPQTLIFGGIGAVIGVIIAAIG